MVNLGTQLRLLIGRLDGDVQHLYDDLGVAFRPRFFPVVQHLLQHGAATVSAIASMTGVSQPAMTQTLRELTALGLVRSQAGSDARERVIELTANGREVSERLLPVWRAVEGAAAELDAELPCKLGDVIAAALQALDRRSFKDRIEDRL